MVRRFPSRNLSNIVLATARETPRLAHRSLHSLFTVGLLFEAGMGALRMRQRAIATTLLLGAVSAFHIPSTRLTARGRARNVLQTGSEVAWKEFGALPPGDWRTAEGPASSVIVGGGPAGMATAIMFAKRGWRNIVVVDRLGAPADPSDAAIWGDTARFYLVGLGARGQRSLAALGAWDDVERYCAAVVGRKDWAPGGVRRRGRARFVRRRRDPPETRGRP